jgi:hypothetical protein
MLNVGCQSIGETVVYFAACPSSDWNQTIPMLQSCFGLVWAEQCGFSLGVSPWFDV